MFLSFSGCFSLASTITAIGIVTERINGNWNRLLSVGVKPKHFLIAQLAVSHSMMMIQVIEFVAAVFFFHESTFTWLFFVSTSLLFWLTATTGLLFGLLCSIIAKTTYASYMVSQFTTLPVYFISGEQAKPQYS